MEAWPGYLEEVTTRLKAVFRFRKTHRWAMAYIEGLFRTVPRKNRGQLAAGHGKAHPYGFPDLLGRVR